MKICKIASVVLLFVGCGFDHHEVNDFTGPPEAPIVNSGGSAWTDTPAGTEAGGVSQPHNTSYCQVDAAGNIISTDTIRVENGPRIHGVGGGCIARPIRDVWALTLDYGAVKAKDVDEYRTTPLPELIDLSKNIFFVFDIENIVRRMEGLITITWVSRWYFTVVNGTYQEPNQIAVNFQKISGSSHVEYDKEGYVLDRVTPTVTSFVVDQTVKITQVNAARVAQNIKDVLSQVRTEPVDWSVLPNRP